MTIVSLFFFISTLKTSYTFVLNITFLTNYDLKYKQKEIKPNSFGGGGAEQIHHRVCPTDTLHNLCRIQVINYLIFADLIFDFGNCQCNQYSGIYVVVVLRAFKFPHTVYSSQQYNVIDS